MEDKVKQTLEKEHSKRFRAMCHRNENINQQCKSLLDFYNREEKKSMHELDLQQKDLKRRVSNYSQEKLVNGLLNDLSDIAMERKKASQLSVMTKIERTESLDSQIAAVPRYLRMEANPFHPSEMSLGSDDLSVSTSHTSQPHNIDHPPAKIQEPDHKSSSDMKMDSSDFIRNVAEKLQDIYDLDRLKMITHVMLKTIQGKERAKYEDKVRLLFNLHRFFLQESNRSQEKERPVTVEPKQHNDHTFLYLRSDRREEIKAENQKTKKAIERKNSVKIPSSSLENRRVSFDQRVSQLSLPPINLTASQDISEKRSSGLTTHKELSDNDFDDIMKIYLRLGHGGVLKLPAHNSRNSTRNKQRSWLRSELRKIPIVTKDGVQDLRVVMKNCRYLRFPKDMQESISSSYF